MKIIFNFTNELPEKHVVKEVINTQVLKGTLITIVNRKLVKRVAGFNIMIENNKRYFYICDKDFSKTFYELKRKITSFEELLNSSLNIIQTVENSTKEKDIYKLLKIETK